MHSTRRYNKTQGARTSWDTLAPSPHIPARAPQYDKQRRPLTVLAPVARQCLASAHTHHHDSRRSLNTPVTGTTTTATQSRAQVTSGDHGSLESAVPLPRLPLIRRPHVGDDARDVDLVETDRAEHPLGQLLLRLSLDREPRDDNNGGAAPQNNTVNG